MNFEQLNYNKSLSNVFKYFHIFLEGSIILFYSARIAALRGNFEKVSFRITH